MDKVLHRQSFISKIETEKGDTLYCVCEFEEVNIAQKDFKFGALTIYDGSNLYKGDCIDLTSNFQFMPQQ